MLEIQVDQASLRRIVEALSAEEDGVKLRRDLARRLRRAVEPAAAASRASLMAMGHAGLPTQGESLRAAVAAGVKVTTRLAGAGTGVRVTAKRGGPRGFLTAARRLNNPAGWRHPVFGHLGRWVAQRGKSGWFDKPLRERRDEYRQAVLEALQAVADRIGTGA